MRASWDAGSHLLVIPPVVSDRRDCRALRVCQETSRCHSVQEGAECRGKKAKRIPSHLLAAW